MRLTKQSVFTSTKTDKTFCPGAACCGVPDGGITADKSETDREEMSITLEATADDIAAAGAVLEVVIEQVVTAAGIAGERIRETGITPVHVAGLLSLVPPGELN